MSGVTLGPVPVPYSPSQDEADDLVRRCSELQITEAHVGKWADKPGYRGVADVHVMLRSPAHPRAKATYPDVPRDEVSITLHAICAEDMDFALKVAHVIARVVPGVSYLSRLMTNAWEARDAARDAQKAAERKLSRVLTGKPPIALGEWIVRIIRREAGDEIWLLNPDGEFRRQGLVFTSLIELWRAHPALRPIAWGEDKHGPWLRVAPVTLIDVEPT